jgi:hypothetical protein
MPPKKDVDSPISGLSFRDIGLQRPGQRLTMYTEREKWNTISLSKYIIVFIELLYIFELNSCLSGDDTRDKKGSDPPPLYMRRVTSCITKKKGGFDTSFFPRPFLCCFLLSFRDPRGTFPSSFLQIYKSANHTHGGVRGGTRTPRTSVCVIRRFL